MILLHVVSSPEKEAEKKARRERDGRIKSLEEELDQRFKKLNDKGVI